MATLRFDEVVPIGRNRSGTTFAVGRLGPRWCGLAVGHDDVDGARWCFVLLNVSDGATLGLTDRDAAIRRTVAIAQAPEEGWGGVDEWCVPEALQGDPEAYRCPYCRAVCCSPVGEPCEADGWSEPADLDDSEDPGVPEAFEPWDEDCPDDADADEPALGSCCGCGVDGPTVRNICMLSRTAPPAGLGTGWGCVVCGLPPDGAIAVLCDPCVASAHPVQHVCVGSPKANRRVRCDSYPEERHEHDATKHPEVEDA